MELLSILIRWAKGILRYPFLTALILLEAVSLYIYLASEVPPPRDPRIFLILQIPALACLDVQMYTTRIRFHTTPEVGEFASILDDLQKRTSGFTGSVQV